MRQHAQDYSAKAENVNIFRKYKVFFMSYAEDEIPWEF